MSETERQTQLSHTAVNDSQAICYLQQAIADGKHWYLALLETIRIWSSVEESYDDNSYRYLIAGEAFDLLLLAQRLCQEIGSLLPEKEVSALLFHGQPPLELSKEEFRNIIGTVKYRGYLNYLYGVIAEKALIFAVEEEVRKERQAQGYMGTRGILDEVYQRIYEATRTTLLGRFRREKDYPRNKSITLTELKEFTYWLFKYRMKQCDKTRVASDTKKGLSELKRQLAIKKTTAGIYQWLH